MENIKVLKAFMAEKGLSQEEITHRVIKFLCIQKGIAQADIARKLKAPRQNVNDVARGIKRTPWIRKGLAKELGVDNHDLWGEAGILQ